MAEAAKVFSLKKRQTRAEDAEAQALRDGLTRTRQLINQAYSNFNSANDPDLIESYVFEINALQARYSYLLRRFKDTEHSEQRTQSREQISAADVSR